MRIRVNKCCCGCNLQTGTKIIAWIYLISGILYIISTTFSLGWTSDMDVFFQIYGNLSRTKLSDDTIIGLGTDQVAGNLYFSSIYGIPGIVFSGVLIAVTIPVLIAAKKNSRPRLLLPWLIFNVITLLLLIGIGLNSFINSVQVNQIGVGILNVVGILLSSGGYYMVRVYIGANSVTFVLLLYGLIAALNIYFGLVINSYRHHLKEMEAQQTNTDVILNEKKDPYYRL